MEFMECSEHQETAGGLLRVAPALLTAVARAAVGTGVEPGRFWSSFSDTVQALGPRNRALLARRDALQARVDAWHDKVKGHTEKDLTNLARGGGGDVDPVEGSLSNLSGSRRAWDRFTWDIPASVSTMSVSISGGSGDADLYMRFGSRPSRNSYDCRPWLVGNNETCSFNNPASGTWHVGLYGYSAYSGVTMNYSYE